MKMAFRNVLCGLAIGFAAATPAAQPRPSVSLVPPNPSLTLVERLMRTDLGGNRIIGTAIDVRRAPVAHASLHLRSLLSGRIVQDTQANAQGEYSFALVEPGTYVVELSVFGTVIALSDAATLGSGELVQTLIQVPGRWDAVRQAVIAETSFVQFMGTSAADTMAGETMTRAANQGIPSVDAGEPVSGQ